MLCCGSDSPGHKPDQPRASLKEEPRAVCLQSEGHADAAQLSGGVLDWKPEESQPEGNTLLNFHKVQSRPCGTVCVENHAHYCALFCSCITGTVSEVLSQGTYFCSYLSLLMK